MIELLNLQKVVANQTLVDIPKLHIRADQAVALDCPKFDRLSLNLMDREIENRQISEDGALGMP